jgi:hypothetical protein
MTVGSCFPTPCGETTGTQMDAIASNLLRGGAPCCNSCRTPFIPDRERGHRGVASCFASQ